MSGILISIEGPAASLANSALTVINSETLSTGLESTSVPVKTTVKGVSVETVTATSNVASTQTSSDSIRTKASQSPSIIYSTITSTPSSITNAREQIPSVAQNVTGSFEPFSEISSVTTADTRTTQTKAITTATISATTSPDDDPDAGSLRHSPSPSRSASTISLAPTTFTTSTFSASSSSSPLSLYITPSLTSSLTPTSTPTPVPAQAVTDNANKIPAAGIAVASVMGLLALVSVLFLIFRYCTPIRNRYESWQERRTEARTYRDAIEGLNIPENKLSRDGSPKPAKFAGQRFYAPEEVVISTRVPEAQGTGLGLGSRLSLLRQHSPFYFGNSISRQSQIGVAVSDLGSQNLPALPR